MLRSCKLTLQVGEKPVYPVWEVDLELRKGERLAVVGESGGGKTSLAWALMGHPLPGQRVRSGRVLFGAADLSFLSRDERAQLYYRRIALVPQNAQNGFHPTQPLWKSAREVMRKEQAAGLDRAHVLDRLAPLGRALELPVSHWEHFPHQLSGGQKQRMALILALLNKPQALLLDEPTNALDELTRQRLIAFLDGWSAANPVGILLLTHDLGLAARWATRIAVLYRGQVVEELPAGRIAEPLHPYTRGLMAATVRFGDVPLSRSSIPGHALPVTGAPQCCGFLERCPCAGKPCRHERPGLIARGEHKVRCLL